VVQDEYGLAPQLETTRELQWTIRPSSFPIKLITAAEPSPVASSSPVVRVEAPFGSADG